MSRILLDTNVVSRLFRGDRQILDILAGASDTYMSAVVIGELEAGFRGGTRYRENLCILDDFLSEGGIHCVGTTRETGQVYGQIWANLKQKGTPIPTNDIWIAAQCLELGAVLVTDDSHFDQVAGLRIWGR